MRKKQVVWVNIALALLFAIIFYGNYIGVNLLLFELIAIPLMIYINRPVKFNFLTSAVLSSVVLSAVMVVVLNTNWSIFINVLLLFIFSTVLAYSGFRSFFHASIETFFRVVTSQFSIFLDWKEPYRQIKGSKFGIRKIFYLIVIPLAVLFLFILLYAYASSVFYEKFEVVFSSVFRFLDKINFIFILLIILGFIIGNALFMKTNPIGVYNSDINASDNLLRARRKYFHSFRTMGLKTQNLSGIVILALLNLLIFYFNILDITNIWFDFEWNGSFLKEFVHEGTWVLVFSIFLSAGIALLFFRGNINFYSKNKPLKILAILWMAQNIIMTVSVMIRNYWYINYFGLAYKRIAVIFFLLLTIIGLITIIWKIINRKSVFFLLRTNSFALLLVLVVSTCVNWDVHIAKFNFKNYNRSLLDYRFLARLNSSALPYTLRSVEELEEIEEIQESVMPFDIHQGYLWDIYKYHDAVVDEKEKFVKRYSHMNFLEWNLADHNTYKKLQEIGEIE